NVQATAGRLTNDLMAAQTMTQNIDPTSGSDQDGPIWGYHFVPNQPAQSITSEEAVEFLTASGPPPPDEFLWLHFSLSNVASEPWLRQYLTLPDTFYESLHSDVDSTHLEQDGDTLVARIHDVLFDFTFDAPVATTSLCIKPRVLVSAHLRPWRSINQLRAAVQAGQVFRSPIEILARLLRDQASVLVDIVRKSKRQVGPMEEQLLAKRVSVSRSELGSLRRMLVRLQRLLAPEPAAFFRLLSRPPDWISPDQLQNLQQAAEKFSTAISDTAALVERVKQLQEELAALVSEQTNRTLFLLTMVTVLALPINLVAGLFGMNVGGIPLNQHPYGFFLVLSPLLILTVFLAYWALVRRRY
ncbi:MAG TPA: transporter, partial [Candidatus Limnocylindrales bacterium]|nr:transporter [Candidatus Limnocylindrales bacterium]